MASSSSTPPPLTSLPKILRIEKSTLPPEEEHMAKSTKAVFSSTLLSQHDYLSIFKNLTVLFIGDNSIRTLYRDLCKALKYGRLLEYTEVNCQNGNYKLIEDEKVVLAGGDIGKDNYRDIHQFHLVNNSTKLIYVYLSSILNDTPIQELNFLRSQDRSLSIDLIVCCSFSSDMNEKKIQESNLTFDTYFQNYSIELENFLKYLFVTCQELNPNCSDFYWMSPLPIQIKNMPIEQQYQFQQTIDNIDLMIKNHAFVKFDRYDIWQRRKDLIVNHTGHFSLHGIREIMDSFARTIGQKYHRAFTSSIPITSLPSSSDNIVSPCNSGGSGGKWPKSSSSSSSNHSQPYQRHH